MTRRRGKSKAIKVEGATLTFDIRGTEPGKSPYLSISFSAGEGYLNPGELVKMKQWCELCIRQNKSKGKK